MPPLREPKYPVIDPNPSFSKTFFNMNPKDILHVVGVPTIGYCMGYLSSRNPLRSYNARFCGSLGALAGMMMGLQRSSQRLLGFMENNSEIVEYGLCPPEELAESQRRLKIFNLAMIEAEKVPEKEKV